MKKKKTTKRARIVSPGVAKQDGERVRDDGAESETQARVRLSRHVDRVREIADEDSRAVAGSEPNTLDPVRRARLLASYLDAAAEVMDQCPRTALGLAIMNELPMTARVNDAWRAFLGLSEDRHRRLALIECIETVAKAKLALTQGKELRGIIAPNLLKAGLLRVGEALGTTAPLATLARDFYAVSFPELARKLDVTMLEKAIVAWGNPGGRPARGTTNIPKWVAINNVAVSAGLPNVAPDSIEREWLKFAEEVRAMQRPEPIPKPPA